jgi:hypothetical protein
LKQNRHRKAPMPRRITDQRLEGWLSQAPRRSADARPGALSRHPAPPYWSAPRGLARPGPSRVADAKTGPPRRHPARPYCSGVRSLTLDGFEQAPQITGVRDDEGTGIRAVPRACQLEGAPHVVFESQRGQLAGGSHRGRASAPSVPSERDRAPHSKPAQALQWTCLWTTQPTLIERGMGVHSNHPLTARRGIRNSRPDQWGLWKPHPPTRGGTARER